MPISSAAGVEEKQLLAFRHAEVPTVRGLHLVFGHQTWSSLTLRACARWRPAGAAAPSLVMRMQAQDRAPR